eukprot:11313309-Ditylum_brightwellii.AAC.1
MLVTEAYKADIHAPTGMFVGSIIDPETGCQLQYKDLIQKKQYCDVWIKAFTKELDQLAQGKCGYKGTSAIFLIKKDEMLRGWSVTYGSIVCNHRPQKADLNQARLVVGGDIVEYPFKVITPTADLVTAKVLMNSVISTEGAKFWIMDINL